VGHDQEPAPHRFEPAAFGVGATRHEVAAQELRAERLQDLAVGHRKSTVDSACSRPAARIRRSYTAAMAEQEEHPPQLVGLRDGSAS
jgi:hypothetical protein